MALLIKAEKSRSQAKRRRIEEAEEISNIATLLPLPQTITQKLDKASVLRLAVTFLRLKAHLGRDRMIFSQISDSILYGENILESVDGFFLIISVQEDILYVSENVSSYSGQKQISLIGKNVYESLCENDRGELQNQFRTQYRSKYVNGVGLNLCGQVVAMSFKCSTQAGSIPILEHKRQFFLRMKSSSPASSERSLPYPSRSGYTLLHCTGYLHYNCVGEPSFMAVIARPLLPTQILHTVIDKSTNLTDHSMDMKLLYCDPSLASLFGYDICEGESKPSSQKSQISSQHGLEANHLATAGLSITRHCKFLNREKERCWLQSRSTIVYSSNSPQYIICVNYVISEKSGREWIKYPNSTEKGPDKVIVDAYSLIQPTGVTQTPQPSVLSEMEGIAFQYCHHLLDKCLKETVKMYSDGSIDVPSSIGADTKSWGFHEAPKNNKQTDKCKIEPKNRNESSVTTNTPAATSSLRQSVANSFNPGDYFGDDYARSSSFSSKSTTPAMTLPHADDLFIPGHDNNDIPISLSELLAMDGNGPHSTYGSSMMGENQHNTTNVYECIAGHDRLTSAPPHLAAHSVSSLLNDMMSHETEAIIASFLKQKPHMSTSTQSDVWTAFDAYKLYSMMFNSQR